MAHCLFEIFQYSFDDKPWSKYSLLNTARSEQAFIFAWRKPTYRNSSTYADPHKTAPFTSRNVFKIVTMY